MRNITKGIFLKYMRCPSLGWLMRNNRVPREPLSPGSAFLREQDAEVNLKARELYPGGVAVEAGSPAEAAQKTADLMKDPAVATIYDGTLFAGEFAARLDILTREGAGWRLVCIRSNVQGKSRGGVKPELLRQAAYAGMVLEMRGVEVAGVTVLTISKGFRTGMETRKLFAETDITAAVKELLVEFREAGGKIREHTERPTKPRSTLSLRCRGCFAFKQCKGKGIKNHIFDIPQMNEELYDQLRDAGISRLEEVRGEFPLTTVQKRVIDSVQSGKPVLVRGLKARLAEIKWPVHYLDFEASMTAIPLYSGMAPYETLPVQYSIHVCDRPGRITAHREYLADPSKDCRRELAARLIEDLKGDGSILIYSPFEKDVVNGLAALYPELARELHALAERMIDLAIIVKSYYYHPDFHGKTSIKTLVPLLLEKLPYDELEIADGTAAMAAFAHMAAGRYGEAEMEKVRRDLLEYCKQDTLAMVMLHEYFTKLVKRKRK